MELYSAAAPPLSASPAGRGGAAVRARDLLRQQRNEPRRRRTAGDEGKIIQLYRRRAQNA